LTEAADLFVIAPATANIIGKIAAGIADDLVSTLLAAASSPVLLAPAMNTRMWENPIVQQNLEQLAGQGRRIVPPGEGWLACRTVGRGRMAEPEEILSQTVAILREPQSKKPDKQ
jgi:phosphopantothenoylcysteine decarboxylase/phosphopantothenate--cysteine ligase